MQFSAILCYRLVTGFVQIDHTFLKFFHQKLKIICKKMRNCKNLV